MRLLVCGGRDFRDSGQIRHHLEKIHAERGPIKVLIHGAAPGADTISGGWARHTPGVKVEPYPADWRGDGLQAGPVRNQRMLDEGRPDLVLAFPGGRGTADMVLRARRAGVEIVFAGGAPSSD